MIDTLASFENLHLAYKNGARGKRGRPAVAAFELKLEDHLFELQSELVTKTYAPGPYYSFYIHEPKKRLISAAPFRDRVVHHALCQLIEPTFERSFIADSYANRIGKGTHRALDRCQTFARRYRYVLLCDIRQFFPSIDHQILGFIVFPDRRRLKRRKGVHFERRLRKKLEHYRQGEVELERVHETVRGWVNHVRYGNTVGLRKSTFRRNLIYPLAGPYGVISHPGTQF